MEILAYVMVYFSLGIIISMTLVSLANMSTPVDPTRRSTELAIGAIMAVLWPLVLMAVASVLLYVVICVIALITVWIVDPKRKPKKK